MTSGCRRFVKTEITAFHAPSGGGTQHGRGRSLSYFSQFSAFNDAISGISFYRVVADLEEHFQERKEELKTTLRRLCRELFCKENLIVSVTCDSEGLKKTEEPLGAFVTALPEHPQRKRSRIGAYEEK